MTFLPDLSDEKALASFSERLNRKLSAEADKLMGTDHGIPLGISMGAAFANIHGEEYSKLFQYADMALYRVKNNGKHGIAIYEAEEYSLNEENLEQELIRTSQILSERGERKGARILGKEAFSWNYRFIIRFMDRYNGVATRLLISLSTSDSGFPETKDVDAFASI